MAVREVGDFVRICNELTEQLDRLSGSELQTMNQVLMHTHSHVVQEMNGRIRRKLTDLPPDEEDTSG